MAAVEGLESHDNAQLYSDLGLGIEKLHVPYAASNSRVRGAVAEAFQHLRTLWHPNISCYTDILRLDGSNYILVSEQYSVSLDDLLDSYHVSSRYNENKLDVYDIDLFNVVHQIVTGIQYLHLHGIEHGSLGTHNVFLDSNGTVKIGCYASEYLRRIALHVIDETAADECPNQPDANSKPYPGIFQRPSDFEMLSKCFSAPELLNRKKQLSYNESMTNDTWSIGMICLQVINALIAKRTIETSGNKCASTKLYRDITSMARCSKSRPIVQDAFAITAKLISVACSNMEKSQSLLGLNVEQMCIDAMKMDIPENDLNCRSKIAHLIDALLERYTDLVLQVMCNHDKHVDPLLIASISSGHAEATWTNDINRYDPVDPDKHQASADGGFDGNISQIHEHPGCTVNSNISSKQNDQRFVINNDVEFSHSGNHVDHREPDEISQDDSYKQYRKLIETAVGILIDWFTSSSLIANMVSFLGIDLDQGSCDPTREHNADVHLIYTLFNMANTCLVVSTEARPRAVDLLLLFKRVNTKSLSHEAPYMWKVTSYHWADNKTNNVGRMTIDYFIERKHRKLCLEETNKRIIPIHVDDLFYFWRLMGNNPIDAISDLDCDPYVVNYQYEFVELIKLLDIMKQADLFPMIIEHQIRPTFAYARQFSFLYQWIRYRRFEKLLFNASESIQQISTEALLDVPPVLRRYIWCVILQVDTNVKPPMSYIEPRYTDTNLEYEIYKVFKRFNNDLLESKRAMQMMVHAIVAIRVTYEIDCLQK
uniref:Protein kinase domain-containing protein n=1 Tax=Babesia bovis TaxID=5865 RepID=A7ARY3_BABBO|eukprot:XP_001610870.1 hypothetical protein [Babesia bovis T2Bo]